MILIGAVLSASCTTVTTRTAEGKETTLSREAFSAYLEHVFRHHNQVMNHLIESSEIGNEQTEIIHNAEAMMITACQPLNEAVEDALSGKEVGLQIEMELPEAVPACEAASQAVEKLLSY